MGIGEKRWTASEKIALRLLEEQGYIILETHKRIRIGGVEVAEIDALAKGPDGETYVVEVKAGRLDVTGVRQAYTNAVLLGARPLVVCKGYADESAKTLAEKLGVKVVKLEDIFLTDPEELEYVVETAIEEALHGVLRILLDPSIRLKPETYHVLKAIAEEDTIQDAAHRIGRSVEYVAQVLDELRRQGILPRKLRRYNTLRGIARLLIYRARLQSLLESMEKQIERLETLLQRLGV